MVNNSKFPNRLKRILEYYQLSASAFAEKINVQRSSISHLLSGRNKPSLDFVLKVLENFKEVDLYWLLNGKGTFPKKEVLNYPATLFSETNDNSGKDTTSQFENNLKKSNDDIIPTVINTNSAIEKIVIFFKDGTFKQYNEKQ